MLYASSGAAFYSCLCLTPWTINPPSRCFAFPGFSRKNTPTLMFIMPSAWNWGRTVTNHFEPHCDTRRDTDLRIDSGNILRGNFCGTFLGSEKLTPMEGR